MSLSTLTTSVTALVATAACTVVALGVTTVPATSTSAAAPAPQAAVAPPAASRTTTGSVPVRVLHYNIRFGSFGLDGVARDIARTGADVVLLNEVDVHTRRPGGIHQARYLARRLGMDWRYDANIGFRFGTRGNAVLTTYDIRGVDRFDLPVPPGTRPRGLMRVRLATRGVELDAWTTHLNAGRGTRPQARQTSLRIGDPSCATVLGVDVNAGPGTPEDTVLRTHLRDAWRAVGRGPGHTNFRSTVRIDYVYYDEVTPRAVWTTGRRSSDHHGVVAALDVSRAASCR